MPATVKQRLELVGIGPPFVRVSSRRCGRGREVIADGVGGGGVLLIGAQRGLCRPIRVDDAVVQPRFRRILGVEPDAP
jgi:hypothetical protein